MKLFLALAFVAMAAALPEPVRLPEPAKPQVAEIKDAKVDAVRFIDSLQQDAEEIKANAVKIADAPAKAALVEDIKVDAIKIADAPAKVPQAENIQVDAVKFVDSPLPEAAEEIPTDAVKVAVTPFELARQAQEIQPEDAVFVHLPLVQFVAAQDEEVKVDAVRFVDSPQSDVVLSAVEKVKVADAVKSVESPVNEKPVKVADLPAPVELKAATLPVVKENQVDAVSFVDSPQAVSPLVVQPILPLDAGMMIVPPQIIDIIMIAEQMKSGQEVPELGKIFADPMLR